MKNNRNRLSLNDIQQENFNLEYPDREDILKVSNKYIFEEINKGYALVKVLLDNNHSSYDFQILEVNKIVESYLDRPTSYIEGRLFSDFYDNIDSEWLKIFDNIFESGETGHIEKYSELFGKFLNVTFIPIKNLFCIILFEDISNLVEVKTKNKDYLNKVKEFNEKLYLTNRELISRQNQLESAYHQIKENESRWMFALEGGSRAVFDFDFKLHNIYYSPSWHNLFGYSPDELSKKEDFWFDLIHDDDVLNVKKVYESYIRGEIDELAVECRINLKDGSIIWIIIKGKIIQYSLQNVPERIIGTFTDITHRKETELALIESESRLKEAQELANQGYWSLNMESESLQWSDQLYKILDIELHEVKASFEHYRSLIHPEDKSMAVNAFQRILSADDDNYNISYRIITPKNRVKYINEVCRAEKNSKSQLTGLFGTIQDITKLRTIEEEFRKTKRRFDVLFESADDRIVLFNITGDIIYANSSFYKALGYKEEEYINIFSVNKYESNFISSGIFKELIDEGKATREYTIKNKKGKDQYMFAKYVCIDPNKQGKFDLILSIIRDVTKFKRTELELIKAIEKAEESDRLKSAFLSNMSHEIRTPLNGILGFVKLLARKNLSDEKRNYYSGFIDTNANQLLAIISDILDIAKIESGQINIQLEPFNLNKFFDDLFVTYDHIIKGKKLNINLFVEKNAKNEKAIIVSDYFRLMQILKNLLNNAIKFTTAGEIIFGYDIINNKSIRFYVKDTGVGISKEKQKIIFERFRQEDDSITRDFGGTGLGLTISAQLVELMHGKMWVNSKKNEGSEFLFEIPLVK